MIKKLILFAFVAFGIGMAEPASRAKIQEAFKPVTDNLYGRLVPHRLEVMADQVDWGINRGEGFPDDFERWLEKVFTADPRDPWGNYYHLQSGRREYTLASMGGDGVLGTEDDISLTRPVPKR